MNRIAALLGLLAALGNGAPATAETRAVGCTLSNPAEDLKYLFPEITSFREEAKDLGRMKDGAALYKKLQERLGSDLDSVYEAFDTPYTVYSVFKGADVIGIVHGVNVPGKGGVIQVFLSTDPKSGEIRALFFQRLESPAASELRAKAFRAQFQGLTLADFYKHDYYAAAEPGSEKDKLAGLKDPTTDPAARPDYQATLRGIRKNLILLDMFVYDLRNEPFYERARDALKKLEKKDNR
jgi:hypothetical protein